MLRERRETLARSLEHARGRELAARQKLDELSRDPLQQAIADRLAGALAEFTADGDLTAEQLLELRGRARAYHALLSVRQELEREVEAARRQAQHDSEALERLTR